MFFSWWVVCNLQYFFKMESYFDWVIDFGVGSYYIEKFIWEIVDWAWVKF